MDDSSCTELYRRYRPQTFKEVVGQDTAIRTLVDLGRRDAIPHAILFTGASGVGKTTIARILKEKLGCSDNDFRELNTADFRGIDMVRDIRDQMSLAPLRGGKRIWLIDECFPAGTKVSTEHGPRPIEAVVEGELVCNAAGVGKVQKTFRNRVGLDKVVRVWFRDNSSIVTTKEHKFLTESATWVEAGDLSQEYLYRTSGRIEHLCECSGWNCLGFWRQQWLAEVRYLERCLEDKAVERLRVDRVEVYEQGRNESSFADVIGDQERDQQFVEFYDLQVNCHPSYFANGILVHNCHQLTPDAQNAFLKILEDTPRHVYFFLATTDPQKLKPTIRTRCTEIKLGLLSDKDVRLLVERVVEGEQAELSDEAASKIVEVAAGSARRALVLLHQAIGLPPDLQLSAIQKGDYTSQGIELARLLVPGRGKPRSGWKAIATILEGLEDEVETVRQIVLSYARSGLLKGWADPKQSYAVIRSFCRPFYDAGQGNAPAAALVAACWEIFSVTGTDRA